MKKFCLIVASKDHVMKAAEGGFAQACHGKKGMLSKPRQGDGVVFYSPKKVLGNTSKKNTVMCFTAIGHFSDDKIQIDNEFHRRRVSYAKNGRDLEIKPLLEKLNFIKNKTKWGIEVRNGMREIPEQDFMYIRDLMDIKSVSEVVESKVD